MAGFLLQWQSCIVLTETTWPPKLKQLTIWTFTKKIVFVKPGFKKHNQIQVHFSVELFKVYFHQEAPSYLVAFSYDDSSHRCSMPRLIHWGLENVDIPVLSFPAHLFAGIIPYRETQHHELFADSVV